MRKLITSQLVLALASALTLWSFTAMGASKPLSQRIRLSSATFTVGSKSFTEQAILGQITIQLLRAAGADVHDQTQLAGSDAVRKALLSGNIDMYWEYTGTAWINYLQHTGSKNESRLYGQVARQDLKRNGIKWLKPARFSNSYALITNHQTADKYHLTRLSDLGPFIKRHPAEASVCTGAEFAQRDDGLPGLEKAYGWTFPNDNISILQESLVFQQVAKGQRCNFGQGTTTEGRIESLHLVLLKDDKHFFPPYYAALNVRAKVYKAHPKLAKLFRPVSQALTEKTMQRMNAQVDVKGKFVEQVAKQFLVSHNFIAQ